MAFATAWLEKRALFPQLITEPPDPHTGIIVVVPAYDEPGIESLLNSLASCEEPSCKVEIIIIVNAYSGAGKEQIANNALCINNIVIWKQKNKECFFRVYTFDAGQPAVSGWGVGLARKTGMDEALRRFNYIGDPNGVIVSLDADCSVEKNYFVVLNSEFYLKKYLNACSIRFEHPLSGDEFPEIVYKYIIMYEMHMRYFYQAVRYSGYPYVFHAIGSAIAFRALAYLKVGGMNRKQAGEDFYFIQKLVPLGGYFSLGSTTVYPSPRTSTRVPFGTGAVIANLLDEDARGLLTYNPAAFRELHTLFCRIEKLFTTDTSGIIDYYKSLPPGIRSFTSQEEWVGKITEIKNNTSVADSFVKRFFGWFNMFRIVKYLNHVHLVKFEKLPVSDAAYEMLSVIGRHVKSKDPFDLLIFYRSLEAEL